MPNRPDADALNWSAFLYVSGELSASESSAFEEILAEDQGAREAVAAAVELAGAAFLAGDGPILALPRRRPAARRLLARSAAAVAAAACVIAVLRPAATAPETRVARAWSGLRESPDGEWPSIVADGHATAPGPEPEAVADVEADATAERGVPSWMLAAAGPKAETPAREGN